MNHTYLARRKITQEHIKVVIIYGSLFLSVSMKPNATIRQQFLFIANNECAQY